MRRTLIIRQEEDALSVEKILTQKGESSCVFPLFSPLFFPCPPLDSPQALIITSKNAIRSLQENNNLKSLPLYAVGEKTAEFAREKGFTNTHNVSGDSQDLYRFILQKASPTAGDLLYLSGEVVKGGLVKDLTLAGFTVKRHIVYKLEAAKKLPSALIQSFDRKEISHVLFFSPHTTSLFIDLLKKERLEGMASEMTSLCLSRDVLKVALGIGWREVWVSPRPTLASIIGYFDAEK